MGTFNDATTQRKSGPPSKPNLDGCLTLEEARPNFLFAP
jgi:hypothetical protein